MLSGSVVERRVKSPVVSNVAVGDEEFLRVNYPSFVNNVCVVALF